MPELPRDYGLDNLALTRRVLIAAGVTCWLGALVALLTGETFSRGRTHEDAVMVLLVLGVVALLSGAMVLAELAGRRRTPEPRRSDYDDS